ncbi:MAG: hypothetical protein RML73_04045 [Anaerolineae bacterium]|nr:hypothetical protein [Anaerolineae bacterium]
MIYRISYIVENDTSPGIITSQDKPPQVGETVNFGLGQFVIIDVCEILPPKDGTQFLIVTLREDSSRSKTMGFSG